PYPYHRDQHQRVNAETLAEACASIVLTDRVEAGGNAEQLRPVLGELMSDADRLAAMSAAAARLGVPDAAARVAELIREAYHR
ncbi:MAG: hypothetical protein JSU68_04305, partial [Phycisphaerales bacterium]